MSPVQSATVYVTTVAEGVVANLTNGWLATGDGIARMPAVGLATHVSG